MATERVANMTIEELQAMIDAAVERKLQELLETPDPRSLDEVYASIDRNRWTPPSDAPSALQMLRSRND